MEREKKRKMGESSPLLRHLQCAPETPSSCKFVLPYIGKISAHLWLQVSL
ncbi:hypothetical protein RchiOBHm_Chr3g0450951 [Rosa chinensis]|uniref:Uncharacterized protein n=1 Tax=Rosa chinensis TaxID=74649 RepID=A0A2P6R5W4_ROSCH|nr:hypothetical protein RchiOBHm_Chr3g0450951 [Rosa chinensis]